jgi:hypothetical protein
MIQLIAQFGAILICAVGSIEGNTDWPESPASYTVIAFPDNYKTDALSQDLINGFEIDPTLVELRKQTKLWSYTESHPDWKYRFAAPGQKYPTVFVMEGDKVVYKRSQADTKAISADIKKANQVFGRFPRICPPNCPDCPDNDNRPNSPNRPPQNRPSPNRPTNPSRPLIPDTAPTLPDTPKPIIPPPDDTKLKELTVRIEKLEATIKVMSLASGKEGPPGPAGKNGTNGRDGENGKPGANGKDAVVDYPTIYATIQKWALAHKNEFASAPQPLAVNFLDGEGRVARTEPVTDGQINIPPQKAWWTRLDGKTVKQSRPLGDALKFQTELRQEKPEGAN